MALAGQLAFPRGVCLWRGFGAWRCAGGIFGAELAFEPSPVEPRCYRSGSQLLLNEHLIDFVNDLDLFAWTWNL